MWPGRVVCAVKIGVRAVRVMGGPAGARFPFEGQQQQVFEVRGREEPHPGYGGKRRLDGSLG